MINIFGISIESPQIGDNSILENLLISVAKKGSERQILHQFLVNKMDEISAHAKNSVGEDIDISMHKPQAVDFFLSTLKTSGVYEKMVLETIANDTQNHSSSIARQILQGKKPDLPPTFPGAHKTAENLVHGAISSSIGPRECQGYLVFKAIKTRIQEIAKDMFYAVNHGLDPDQTQRFISTIYELEKLKTTDFTNPGKIKENILHSIQTGLPLSLLHLKCLRFTYPDGNRLLLLNHTHADNSSDNHSRRPQDESTVFYNLRLVKSIFEEYGINCNLIILVSDQDLIDYFPNGGEGIIPDPDIDAAKLSLNEYQNAVAAEAPFATVKLLRQYLEEQNLLSVFDLIHHHVVDGLYRGTSTLSERYVESKVDYRFNSNSKIFKAKPSREFSRSRVYAQIASLQSLSVLGQEHILIEEDHGNDNQFIGGYKKSALPVVFISLKN